jgi:hypothetical protein
MVFVFSCSARSARRRSLSHNINATFPPNLRDLHKRTKTFECCGLQGTTGEACSLVRAFVGQAVPEWAASRGFTGQRKPPRSCTLVATVFPNLGFSPPRSHLSPGRARPASVASISHNSRSDKHLNGFSKEECHLNSKRLESRACENCGGNLEDQLLYNGWISCVRPRKNRKRVSSVIEETSHTHWRKAGHG